jgi:hypothetical protein
MTSCLSWHKFTLFALAFEIDRFQTETLPQSNCRGVIQLCQDAPYVHGGAEIGIRRQPRQRAMSNTQPTLDGWARQDANHPSACQFET